ncbi:hypothetical protein VIC_001961 [Vibrio coralliilyticus ATCC BAA-450]|nr:hypothetical protein VIC_001961 [Vibrio coralliilyticus ATCC BAA-450]
MPYWKYENDVNEEALLEPLDINQRLAVFCIDVIRLSN